MNQIERQVRKIVNPYSTAFTRWWCHSGRHTRVARIMAAARSERSRPATSNTNAGTPEAAGLHTPTQSMAARRAAIDAVVMNPTAEGKADAGHA
jgi:hypothetical protein